MAWGAPVDEILRPVEGAAPDHVADARDHRLVHLVVEGEEDVVVRREAPEAPPLLRRRPRHGDALTVEHARAQEKLQRGRLAALARPAARNERRRRPGGREDDDAAAGERHEESRACTGSFGGEANRNEAN